jgi:hypothetical protein
MFQIWVRRLQFNAQQPLLITDKECFGKLLDTNGSINAEPKHISIYSYSLIIYQQKDIKKMPQLLNKLGRAEFIRFSFSP